jgi:hypothetical protein
MCAAFASKIREINREKLPAHRTWNSALNVDLINFELLVASLGNTFFPGVMFYIGSKTLTIGRKRFIPVQSHSIHFFLLRTRVVFRIFNHAREDSLRFNQGLFEGTNIHQIAENAGIRLLQSIKKICHFL